MILSLMINYMCFVVNNNVFVAVTEALIAS